MLWGGQALFAMDWDVPEQRRVMQTEGLRRRWEGPRETGYDTMRRVSNIRTQSSLLCMRLISCAQALRRSHLVCPIHSLLLSHYVFLLSYTCHITACLPPHPHRLDPHEAPAQALQGQPSVAYPEPLHTPARHPFKSLAVA